MVGSYFFGEVLGLHGLGLVDVHGEVVVRHPFLGYSLEFAGDGVLCDFHAGHRHQRLALFELGPLLGGELVGVEGLLALVSHGSN